MSEKQADPAAAQMEGNAGPAASDPVGPAAGLAPEASLVSAAGSPAVGRAGPTPNSAATPERISNPAISWDFGTAFDLFASLYAIFTPGEFGLRASWAAGVRSRLSAESRDFLTLVMRHMDIPTHWLHNLPQPKNTRAVLDILEKTPPEKLLEMLNVNPQVKDPWQDVEMDVLARGAVRDQDIKKYFSNCTDPDCTAPGHNPESIREWLTLWADPRKYGELFLKALMEYYEGFFRAEERRIMPDLEAARERAQKLALTLSPLELFEELSQGIRVRTYVERPSLILVPCYWCSPRIMPSELDPSTGMVLFGARPPEASLIPGDTVPAKLLLGLEALSDPTRLTILRALYLQPMTQTDIAKTLRLRTPTISHHLKSLRIAGLISYLDSESGGMRYQARSAQVEDLYAELKGFLTAP